MNPNCQKSIRSISHESAMIDAKRQRWNLKLSRAPPDRSLSASLSFCKDWVRPQTTWQRRRHPIETSQPLTSPTSHFHKEICGYSPTKSASNSTHNPAHLFHFIWQFLSRFYFCFHPLLLLLLLFSKSFVVYFPATETRMRNDSKTN